MTSKLISIRERLLDAADLVIDFATLGEYGLEPAVPQDCERPEGITARGSDPVRAGRAEGRRSAVPS